MEENSIGSIVIDAAFEVHRNLGPGLLETVYETAMAHELQQRDLKVQRQLLIPVEYKGVRSDEGFRADIVVQDKVILELKSTESVSEAHKKQIQTYLRLTGCKLGYLLNFGEALMRDGITRSVNGLTE